MTAFEESRSMGDCMSPAQKSGKLVAHVAWRREKSRDKSKTKIICLPGHWTPGSPSLLADHHRSQWCRIVPQQGCAWRGLRGGRVLGTWSWRLVRSKSEARAKADIGSHHLRPTPWVIEVSGYKEGMRTEVPVNFHACKFFIQPQ